MNGANVKQLYESFGPQGFYDKITACLKEGRENPSGENALQPEQIDLQEMAIGVLGERNYIRLGERYARRRGDPSAVELTFYGDAKTGARYEALDQSSNWRSDPGAVLREAGETGADLAAFSAITGQIAYNAIGKGWNNAEMVGDRLYYNFPTEFSGQKIPWLSNLFTSPGNPYVGDSDIQPGMPYPEASLGPRWVSSPKNFKKGSLLSLSLEFMLFDRTGQAGARGLEALGKAVRYQKEYMQLRVMMGFNPIGALTSNIAAPWGYNLNGTYMTVYNTGTSNFTNAMGATPLVDFTSLNQGVLLRSRILDPDTGRPMNLGAPKTLFVMPNQVWFARRILTATNVRSIYPAYSAASVNAPGNVQVDSANPVEWKLEVLTSPIAQQILAQATVNPAGVAGAGSGGVNSSAQIQSMWWMLGEPLECLWYAQIFDFKREQAVAGNIRELEQDLKLRYKVSEMGVPFWYDPRNALFFYNT